ncbi:MAG TPA: GntR family transcriptional regulator [Steroidobacteraceae bacterium]|nr:GntR family transcriptional regulator [Steroidobacteraceae bacterium]
MASRTAHRTNKSKPARGSGFPAQRKGRGVARYYLLYEHLSGALNDGTIPAGGALPSEPELVVRYKLSRTTVRRALARLEDEGRIIRRRGSGTFARQTRKPPRLHLDLHTFFDDLPELASQTTTSILRFEFGAVPTSLRELQPQLGARALVIQRVHRFHGTPYAVTTAYVPERIGRKIRRTALERASLLTVLDQQGPRTSKTEYTTSAVAADAIATKRLDVALGVPLLRTRAVLSDTHNQLNAVIESLCRPDRFSVRAALERTRNSNSQWRLKR